MYLVVPVHAVQIVRDLVPRGRPFGGAVLPLRRLDVPAYMHVQLAALLVYLPETGVRRTEPKCAFFCCSVGGTYRYRYTMLCVG